jgi:hypothetical protein
VYLAAAKNNQDKALLQNQRQLQYVMNGLPLTKGFIIDFVLLILGILATVISTVYTLRQIRAGNPA